MKKYNIAVVGATGLVGSTILKVLAEKNIPIKNLYCYASKRSKGKIVKFNNRKYKIIELCAKNIINKKIDYALFSAGGSVSKTFAPIFAKQGVTVIDNSSAWRMNDSVPLIVPEVNGEDIGNSKIIANPNCSTIQCMAPLKALHSKYLLKKVNYTTFQAVSGSGVKGLLDLEKTSKGENSSFYPYPIFNNCLPHIGDFLENGYTTEEMKMVNESRKILKLPYLKVSATCVRVPVKNSHSVQVEASFEKELNKQEIINLLKEYNNIVILDDNKNNIYPLATKATGTNKIYVGRIRIDLNNPNIVHMFCVADNIRKGAASNAVEILEKLIKNK